LSRDVAGNLLLLIVGVQIKDYTKQQQSLTEVGQAIWEIVLL
jgi:hypothetical protein